MTATELSTSGDCISVDMPTGGGGPAGESSTGVGLSGNNGVVGSRILHTASSLSTKIHREREANTSDGASQSLLVRNGNELRRSLRRINSLTRNVSQFFG